jgi:hypothetical protein
LRIVGLRADKAKLLASLDHPIIDAIHGLEEYGGTNFLVLEPVEGETPADPISVKSGCPGFRSTVQGSLYRKRSDDAVRDLANPPV